MSTRPNNGIKSWQRYCGPVVIAWLTFNLFVPVWCGTSYFYDDFQMMGWQQSGLFGITTNPSVVSGSFYRRAPLWNPPTASGPLPYSVRWPFDPVSRMHHVEISMSATWQQLLFGLMITGISVAGIIWKTGGAVESRFAAGLAVAGLFLAGAFILLAILQTLTLGFGPGEWIVNSTLVAALAAGLFYSVRHPSRQTDRHVEPAGHHQARISDGVPSTPVAWHAALRVLAFLGGGVAGLICGSAIGEFAESFRGPATTSGLFPFSKVYERDQTVLNLTGGTCMIFLAVLAPIIAVHFKRFIVPAIGFAVALAPLGLIFVFQ